MSYTTSGIVLVDPKTHNFLIMKSKWNAQKWSFSKGFINKNEQPLEAALRELKEETQIELFEYDLQNKTYTIEIKLPKPTRKIPSSIKTILFYVAFIDENIEILLSREHSQFCWTSDFEKYNIEENFVKLAKTIKTEML